jgi:hypothetical protein
VLSGICIEQQRTTSDVCDVEIVDGAQADIAGAAYMSAPLAQAKTRKHAQSVQNRVKSVAQPLLVVPCKHSHNNSRFSRGYSDHT